MKPIVDGVPVLRPLRSGQSSPNRGGFSRRSAVLFLNQEG
mgnify:CR=1 FL=1